MKKKKPEVTEKFIASNGVLIEFVPDKEAGRPFTEAQWKNAKRISTKEAGITPKISEALAEMRGSKGRGRPKVEHPKKPISFRFDSIIVDHLKHDVKFYNRRVEALISKAMSEGRL